MNSKKKTHEVPISHVHEVIDILQSKRTTRSGPRKNVVSKNKELEKVGKTMTITVKTKQLHMSVDKDKNYGFIIRTIHKQSEYSHTYAR